MKRGDIVEGRWQCPQCRGTSMIYLGRAFALGSDLVYLLCSQCGRRTQQLLEGSRVMSADLECAKCGASGFETSRHKGAHQRYCKGEKPNGESEPPKPKRTRKRPESEPNLPSTSTGEGKDAAAILRAKAEAFRKKADRLEEMAEECEDL